MHIVDSCAVSPTICNTQPKLKNHKFINSHILFCKQIGLDGVYKDVPRVAALPLLFAVNEKNSVKLLQASILYL